MSHQGTPELSFSLFCVCVFFLHLFIHTSFFFFIKHIVHSENIKFSFKLFKYFNLNVVSDDGDGKDVWMKRK